MQLMIPRRQFPLVVPLLTLLLMGSVATRGAESASKKVTLPPLPPVSVPRVAGAAGTNGLPFEKEIIAFEASDATNRPAAGAVLFVGSSSIRLWKTLASD